MASQIPKQDLPLTLTAFNRLLESQDFSILGNKQKPLFFIFIQCFQWPLASYPDRKAETLEMAKHLIVQLYPDEVARFPELFGKFCNYAFSPTPYSSSEYPIDYSPLQELLKQISPLNNIDSLFKNTFGNKNTREKLLEMYEYTAYCLQQEDTLMQLHLSHTQMNEKEVELRKEIAIICPGLFKLIYNQKSFVYCPNEKWLEGPSAEKIKRLILKYQCQFTEVCQLNTLATDVFLSEEKAIFDEIESLGTKEVTGKLRKLQPLIQNLFLSYAERYYFRGHIFRILRSMQLDEECEKRLFSPTPFLALLRNLWATVFATENELVLSKLPQIDDFYDSRFCAFGNELTKLYFTEMRLNRQKVLFDFCLEKTQSRREKTFQINKRVYEQSSLEAKKIFSDFTTQWNRIRERKKAEENQDFLSPELIARNTAKAASSPAKAAISTDIPKQHLSSEKKRRTYHFHAFTRSVDQYLHWGVTYRSYTLIPCWFCIAEEQYFGMLVYEKHAKNTCQRRYFQPLYDNQEAFIASVRSANFMNYTYEDNDACPSKDMKEYCIENERVHVSTSPRFAVFAYGDVSIAIFPSPPAISPENGKQNRK